MIIGFIKKHFWTFGIFSLVGIMAFVIDWVIFNLFYKLTSIFILSLSFGWATSMVFNFTINRNVTFSARGFSIKFQALRWLLVYFIAFLARGGLGKLIIIIIGESPLNVNIAFFAGIAISIPISFFGSLLWVFKRKIS